MSWLPLVSPSGCSCAGGKVHVQAIKEGSLTVESNGGDVHIGSVAGAMAEVLTAGVRPPMALDNDFSLQLAFS